MVLWYGNAKAFSRYHGLELLVKHKRMAKTQQRMAKTQPMPWVVRTDARLPANASDHFLTFNQWFT